MESVTGDATNTSFSHGCKRYAYSTAARDFIPDLTRFTRLSVSECRICARSSVVFRDIESVAGGCHAHGGQTVCYGPFRYLD